MKIGILTDIHENREMLEEALRLADFNRCDELVCLGDIVGYDRRFYKFTRHRSAKACLGLIKSNCRWIVAGNHDLFAAGRFPAYSNGFEYPSEWFAMSQQERKSVSRGMVWCYECDDATDLDEDDIAYMKSLPEYVISSISSFPALFSHYIYPDLTGSATRYIERNHQLKEAWEFMKLNQVKLSFTGHSHTSFAGFAYQGRGSFLKAIHSIPSSNFNIGREMVIIALPPLAGEKGRTTFSVIDTDSMLLNIISTNIP